MKIWIDIDGVIVDFLNPFISNFNKRFHTNFEVSDVFCYNLVESFGVLGDLIEVAVHETITDNDFKEINGCVKAIENLSKIADIIIMTSREEKYSRFTYRLIEKLGITYNYITHNKKDFFDGFLDDFFIDDNVCECVLATEKSRNVILFDQPYNRKSKLLNNNIIRACSWKWIENYISEKIRGRS